MLELVNIILFFALLVILINQSARVLFKFSVAAGFLGCAPCPTGTIPSVSEATCTPDWQRITRLFFQKRTSPQDSFTPTNIVTQTAWTTRLTATNDTKIVPTPRGKLKKFGITPGELIRTNDTPTGEERVLGKVMGDKVAFMFENLTPAQYSELQNLFCYPLVVFFATAENVVIGKETTSPTTIEGFPIYGRPIMNNPTISPDLPIQPRNFQVEFSLEDPYWYAFVREFATTFINII